ncbi:spore coat protein YsxE [Metabacillus indicus]|uniref:spore coat protein YsxE n=1 Tax=Metabacillus indicus TaxID=246786 RepID=UPI003CECAD5A
MMRENMDKLAEVLKEYELKAEYAESVTDKLTKVYASSGASYALKKMSSNRNGQFIETLHGAHQKGYSGYVPIFRNRHRQFFTSDGENWYYIMPWLTNETEEERDERHKNMFRELAALHQRTAAEEKLNQNALKIHYDTLAKQWDDNKALYEKYVEECEKKWYLSPFELQAVTYYFETARATEFARKKLDEWYEMMKEKEDVRQVMIHGRASIHHYLYDEQGTGYFTNFEHARYSSPIDDALLFYHRTFHTYPFADDNCADWFYTYQQTFPYREEEMQLFICYLAYPDFVYKQVKKHMNLNDRSASQLQKNQDLIKSYWTFKNIEYFVMKVTQIEENKKMAAEQST